MSYGFKSPLINFAYQEPGETFNGYQNRLTTLTFDGLKITNVVHYHPGVKSSLLFNLRDDVASLSVKNFEVSDVDSILGSSGLFTMSNYGEATISDGSVTNFNKKAYELDSEEYLYVSTQGGVVTFEQIGAGTFSAFKYSISDVVLSGIYAKAGGAFYLAATTGVTNGHPTEVILNRVTVKDSFSYTSGMFHAKSGSFTVEINESTFQSNTGIKGEADLRVEILGSLEVTSTTFSLFKSLDSTNGLSITFVVPKLTFDVTFTSVTVK